MAGRVVLPVVFVSLLSGRGTGTLSPASGGRTAHPGCAGLVISRLAVIQAPNFVTLIVRYWPRPCKNAAMI